MNIRHLLLLIALFILLTPADVAEAQSFDVSAVSRDPIYDWKRIPYNAGLGYYPFSATDWVAGHFVVGGHCNSAVTGKPGVYQYSGGALEAGGMYVFRENGSFLGTRDVCYDTTAPPSGCFETGGCSVGTKVQPVDESSFIRQLDVSGFGFVRSPVRYQIGNLGVNRLERLFFNTDRFPSFRRNFGDITNFSGTAYANGVMVGIETRFVGTKSVGEPGSFSATEVDNSFYAIPGMTKVASISQPLPPPSRVQSGARPLTNAVFNPIAGIGKFFVARPYRGGDANTRNLPNTGVYSMPTASELLSGVEPELLHALEPFSSDENLSATTFKYDAINPSRIGFVDLPSRVSTVQSVRIYEATSNGLSLISTTPLPGLIRSNMVAIAGDYIAYGKCSGSRRNEVCELVVLKDGIPLSVEPLPKTPIDNIYGSIGGGDSQIPVSIAISPGGKILMSLRGGAANGLIYLYQINEVVGGGIPDPDPLPDSTTTPAPTDPLQTDFFRGLIDRHVKILQEILNRDPDTQLSPDGAGSPGNETEFFGNRTLDAVKRFQTKHGIANEGDDGFGTVGPRTKARLMELSGGSSQPSVLPLQQVPQSAPESASQPTVKTPSSNIEDLNRRIIDAKSQLDALRSRLNSLIGQ